MKFSARVSVGVGVSGGFRFGVRAIARVRARVPTAVDLFEAISAGGPNQP